MELKEFKKPHGGRGYKPTMPSMTVMRHGAISFNAPLMEKLGYPSRVRFFFVEKADMRNGSFKEWYIGAAQDNEGVSVRKTAGHCKINFQALADELRRCFGQSESFTIKVAPKATEIEEKQVFALLPSSIAPCVTGGAKRR